MMMLETLDVLIGLVVVLVALSMAVTLITQGIIAALNSRGRHLTRGLTDLLQQLDPALTAAVSDAVASRLLTHPLVSGSRAPGGRYGNVVHREEFTTLLFALGTGDGTHTLDAGAQAALKSALAANGVADPKAALKNIRTAVLQLERSHPELDVERTSRQLHEPPAGGSPATGPPRPRA